MTERLELPIQIEDIDCVSKCWIYNRMAIVKTSPYYRDWVASHYNLIASSGFGFGFENVTPAYHEEILIRKPVHLFHLTKQNIVDKLKGYLRDGYYVNMMVKQYKNEDYIHEVVFYGFDDSTECFMVVGLEERIFQAMSFSYSYIEDMIEEVQEVFFKDEGRGMKLALGFQYPVTIFRLNPNFNPDNCVFEAYRKIERELKGEFYDLHFAGEFAEYKSHPYGYRYKGICCLDIFKKMLEIEIRGEEFHQWFVGITRETRTLVEHRQMMKKSLDYIIDKWELAVTDAARESAKGYGECSTTATTWLNLCLKYELTKDKRLLERIVEQVPGIYAKEKQCLEVFISEGIDKEKLNLHYM